LLASLALVGFARSLTRALASNGVFVGLTVQVENERGERDGDLWWHQRLNEVLVAERPETQCLRFIDPYGNTVFNQLQLPVLLDELREVRTQLTDPELRSMIDTLSAMVQRAANEVHTYIRCIGD
jgi:hypothetical protein